MTTAEQWERVQRTVDIQCRYARAVAAERMRHRAVLDALGGQYRIDMQEATGEPQPVPPRAPVG